MIPSVLLLLCLEGRDRAVPTRQNVLGGLGTFRSLCLFFLENKKGQADRCRQAGPQGGPRHAQCQRPQGADSQKGVLELHQGKLNQTKNKKKTIFASACF